MKNKHGIKLRTIKDRCVDFHTIKSLKGSLSAQIRETNLARSVISDRDLEIAQLREQINVRNKEMKSEVESQTILKLELEQNKLIHRFATVCARIAKIENSMVKTNKKRVR